MAIILFLGDIIICLKRILDLQIPVITDDAIFPVPINPSFIVKNISVLIENLSKKKAPLFQGGLNFY